MIDEVSIISVVNNPSFWYQFFGSAYVTQKELKKIKLKEEVKMEHCKYCGQSVFNHNPYHCPNEDQSKFVPELEPKVIPSDGFLDGGEPYTEEELKEINRNIK